MHTFFGDWRIQSEWMSNTEEERKTKINQIIRKLCIAEFEKQNLFDYNDTVAWTGDASTPQKRKCRNHVD